MAEGEDRPLLPGRNRIPSGARVVDDINRFDDAVLRDILADPGRFPLPAVRVKHPGVVVDLGGDQRLQRLRVDQHRPLVGVRGVLDRPAQPQRLPGQLPVLVEPFEQHRPGLSVEHVRHRRQIRQRVGEKVLVAEHRHAERLFRDVAEDVRAVHQGQ